LTSRDEQIAAIRGRNRNLRKDRLDECYLTIRRAYEREIVIDHLAQVVEERDRTPSDYRVLSNDEARHLQHFNDDSYHWDSYCQQLGRSIVFGEIGYVFEELQHIPAPGVPIDSRHPRFDAVLSATRELTALGHRPNILCAPIGLFVPFTEQNNRTIDWYSTPNELLIAPGGPTLEIHWSSALAPLDRFIVFDSRKTIWRVKLDPVTDHRLTVMIGEPPSPAEAVAFLAETVAKFEITDRTAVRSIAVTGESELNGGADDPSSQPQSG